MLPHGEHIAVAPVSQMMAMRKELVAAEADLMIASPLPLVRIPAEGFQEFAAQPVAVLGCAIKAVCREVVRRLVCAVRRGPLQQVKRHPGEQIGVRP